MKNPHPTRSPLRPAALLFTTLLCSTSAHAQSGYEWSKEFDVPYLEPHEGIVHDSVIFDDGSGPALYLAGNFARWFGEAGLSLIRYDGQEWMPVGGSPVAQFGFPGEIFTLEVFDPDGAGPALPLLVAGGRFSTVNGLSTNAENVAAWNGATWQPLGTGLGDPHFSPATASQVEALRVFDSGSGPRLYAAGRFAIPGGASQGIAVWDGVSWNAVGSASTSSGWGVALEVYDSGAGEELYLGGNFTSVGGVANSAGLARWNGVSWAAVAPAYFAVDRMVVFDADGPGGNPARLVTKSGGNLKVWDGSTVVDVAGFSSFANVGLAVFDDGSGPAVYVGADDYAVSSGRFVHRWDGASATLAPFGEAFVQNGLYGRATVYSLFEFGGELHASGLFEGTALAEARNLVKWVGARWERMFEPRGLWSYDANDTVYYSDGFDAGRARNACYYDDGSGTKLFVGGIFNRAGTVAISQNIATWDGANWSDAGGFPAPPNPIYGVRPLGVLDNGTGAALYVAVREYFVSSGIPLNGLFRYDSSGWSSVGPAYGANFDDEIIGLEVYDDGSGLALFAATRSTIQKFAAGAWTTTVTSTPFSISVMRSFDDGSGPALYVGGSFASFGGVPAANLARLSGGSWQSVGSGLNGRVAYLQPFDAGSGEVLVLGGEFSSHGFVANWNGTSLTAMPGLNPAFPNDLRLVGTHHDGSSNRLYAQVVNGSTSLWGVPLYSWDGSGWTIVPDSHSTGYVYGMIDAHPSFGAGQGVYMWGDFWGTGGAAPLFPESGIDTANQSGNFVFWGSSEQFATRCAGNGGVQPGCTPCPCGNDALAGTNGGCLNSALTSAQLTVSGAPSIAGDSLRFEMSGGVPVSFAILTSGAAIAPTNPVNPCFGLDSGVASALLDGLRCAVQNVQRHGARPIDANGDIGVTTNGWGPPSGPVGGLLAQGGFTAGQIRHYQVIYRDNPTLGCLTGQNTSQSITVVVLP